MNSTSINWDNVHYFIPEEFDDPLYPGSGRNIDPSLLTLLIRLRTNCGWPILTHHAVGGCVDVDGSHGHAPHSYHLLAQGCKACDFHFLTTASPRIQFLRVVQGGFTGVGVYYDWHWEGSLLPIAFHVDVRPVEKAQLWKRVDGNYEYLLR